MFRKALLFVIIVVTASYGTAVAQPPDSDGDGIPDVRDDCPDQPGPLDNNGCPVSEGNPSSDEPPPAGDRDGDGLTDDIDFCIDQPGPLENGGCPLPGETPTPAPPLPELPPLDTAGAPCLAATIGYTPVNLRQWPNLTGPVVGQLDPFSTYPVLQRFSTPEGDWLRTFGGWFSELVVRLGGDCSNLPQTSTGVVNPTFLQQMSEPPLYENVADLPATRLMCDGAAHGVLFGMDVMPPQSDGEGNCFYPLGSNGYGLLIQTDPLSFGMIHPPEPGQPAEGNGDVKMQALIWNMPAPTENAQPPGGSDHILADAALVAETGIVPEEDYQPLLAAEVCPTTVMMLGPGSGDGGETYVGILTAAHCLFSGEQSTLGESMPESVWEGLFNRAMHSPGDNFALPDSDAGSQTGLPPEVDENQQNFGLMACDDSACAVAVVTQDIPGLSPQATTDCVTVDYMNPFDYYPYSVVAFLPTNNCPGGHLKGTTVNFLAFVPPETPTTWVLACSPVNGGWTKGWYYYSNPYNVTLNWGPIGETLQIQCELYLFLE